MRRRTCVVGGYTPKVGAVHEQPQVKTFSPFACEQCRQECRCHLFVSFEQQRGNKCSSGKACATQCGQDFHGVAMESPCHAVKANVAWLTPHTMSVHFAYAWPRLALTHTHVRDTPRSSPRTHTENACIYRRVTSCHPLYCNTIVSWHGVGS
jgi:hypothetical protein